MFEIKVTEYFESAHQIDGHNGKCQNLHGHNWKVEVICEAESLDEIGMACDFYEVRLELKEVITPLDHVHLNTLEPFQKANPTSENVAKYIYKKMKEKVKKFNGVCLKAVVVFETDRYSAKYYE